MEPSIVLIKPPIPYHLDPSEQQPLGIGYVAAQTMAAGYPTSLVDLGADDPTPDVLDKIPEADVYGLTATFLDLKVSHYIASLLRKRYPRAVLVIGGLGPTASPEFIDGNIFHAYVVGEGERAILDILEDRQRGAGIRPRYATPPIEDLDDIPFPARELYAVQGHNIFAFGQRYVPGEATGLITSRGCPFDCAYCATNGIWERMVRFRSSGNVLAEIEACVSRFGIRQFRMQDDNFTLRKGRLREICQGVIDRGLEIFWRCSTSANLVDPEILALMKASGCTEISYGAESGDPDVLKLVDRKQDLETIITSTNNAREAGIRVRLYFMVGLPGTTAKTATRDIAFLKRARPHSINLAIYTPYPGSPVWKDPSRYGVTILTKDFDNYNMHLHSAANKPFESVISLATIDRDGLERQKRMVVEYAEGAGIVHRVATAPSAAAASSAG